MPAPSLDTITSTVWGFAISACRGTAAAFAELWNSIKPDVVLTYDPSFPEPYTVHPDHLTAGRAVLNLARSDLGEGVDVYFYATRDTNVAVDITPVVEGKVQAVLAHRSQIKLSPLLYSVLVRMYGRLRGLPVQAAFAEGFRALSLPRLEEAAKTGQWIPEGKRPTTH